MIHHYTYYDKIKSLNSEGLKQGLLRFGRVLKGSRDIQALTGRNLHSLSEIFFDVGVGPTHVSDLEKGMRVMQEDTLQRLVPFCFQVEYFEFVAGDKIGIPHFKYKGENYKHTEKQRKMKIMSKFVPTGTNEMYRPKISELPDVEFRYHNCRELIDIILGEPNIVSKYSLQSDQENMPILSLL